MLRCTESEGRRRNLLLFLSEVWRRNGMGPTESFSLHIMSKDKIKHMQVGFI